MFSPRLGAEDQGPWRSFTGYSVTGKLPRDPTHGRAPAFPGSTGARLALVRLDLRGGEGCCRPLPIPPPLRAGEGASAGTRQDLFFFFSSTSSYSASTT